VDAAAARASRDSAAKDVGLGAELVERAGAIARGQRRRGSRSGHARRALDAELRTLEGRARRVPVALASVAALDFLGDAVAAATVEHRFEPGEARAAVAAAADDLGVPADAAQFLVFRRALASRECIQLPATMAGEFAVSLLLELAPVAAASLWVLDAGGAVTCLAGCGKAPQSRRIRDLVHAALDGTELDERQIRVQIVERWDRPYAALVARRARGGDPASLDPYLAEAATALSPMLERVADIDREFEFESDTVSPVERRLTRLAFDLHDGPLQEIVALAEELRIVFAQVDNVVPSLYRSRVRGRFDDLHARLGSLDESLREIARSTSSTTAAARPVEEALESELHTLEQTVPPIATELDVTGDLDDLTNSQKIVLFRVVQEALSNVRKHSHASKVSVALRSTRRFLDLTVSDDGCGFDPGVLTGERLGLSGLAERVRLLGGVVEIESHPGAGATVRATLPQWRPSPDGLAGR